MRVGICGAGGRMGRAITRIAMERQHQITAAFDDPAAETIGVDVGILAGAGEAHCKVRGIAPDAVEGTDGIIDFSAPAATMELLSYAKEKSIPMVIGTTGFTEEARETIDQAAKVTPLLFSPNFSLGVNLLFRLTQIAAAAISDDYEVEIFEAHHHHKKDAPSGTAARLVEIIKENKEFLRDAKEVHGRQGIVGAREQKEIGVHAMRAGDIVGEHTVFFAGEGERIELTHRATNRDTFARGAVYALEFLKDAKPGIYSMYDVLGL